MKYVFSILAFFIALSCFAQQESTKSLQDRADSFLKQGDYANAQLVLQRALQQAPDNTDILKDLAFLQFLQREYDKAANTVKPLVDRKDAEVPVFQVAALVYKAREDEGEVEKIYKKGLKKFPSSGVLYSEYGDLLWSRQDYSAIKFWEKGIEVDPNYPGNYFYASRYYFFTMDKVWSIIYGEIFVNMESYTRRTVEIKKVLADSYKKLFIDDDIMKNQNNNNPFASAFLNTMKKQAQLASMGITPESLTMIRTRFILDWDNEYASKFPYRLFDYQRQLLKEGLFEAYNQWLFGAVQNLTAFQTWINTHPENYRDFINFHKGRLFKMGGQLYQNNQNK